ncbi:MAG: hypothetical protein FWD37_01260 [Methanomassiliicoccaceae archaeon]|nr:hypothetical protein [Methanomassiliicoccaceae archaeon]
MNSRAVASYMLTFTIAVLAVIISAINNEPRVLTSGVAALGMICVVIFFSLSRGKNMIVAVPLFMSLCLLVSITSVVLDMNDLIILYSMRTVSYLGAALLCLAILFAYFELRLDRMLTVVCILAFEVAISVLGVFAIRLMIMSELDNTLMETYVQLAAEYTMGMVFAIIGAIAVLLILRKNNIFLVTDRTVLEGD